jgi:hypothetical protein
MLVSFASSASFSIGWSAAGGGAAVAGGGDDGGEELLRELGLGILDGEHRMEYEKGASRSLRAVEE